MAWQLKGLLLPHFSDRLFIATVKLMEVMHQFQVPIFKFAKFSLLVVLEAVPVRLQVTALSVQLLDCPVQFLQSAFIFIVGPA